MYTITYLKIKTIHKFPMCLVSISKKMISDLNIFMKTSPSQESISSDSKYSTKTISHGLIYPIPMLKYPPLKIKSWSKHQESHGKLKEPQKNLTNHIKTKLWTHQLIKIQLITTKYSHLKADHNLNSRNHQLNKNNLKSWHKVSI